MKRIKCRIRTNTQASFRNRNHSASSIDLCRHVHVNSTQTPPLACQTQSPCFPAPATHAGNGCHVRHVDVVAQPPVHGGQQEHGDERRQRTRQQPAGPRVAAHCVTGVDGKGERACKRQCHATATQVALMLCTHACNRLVSCGHIGHPTSRAAHRIGSGTGPRARTTKA